MHLLHINKCILIYTVDIYGQAKQTICFSHQTFLSCHSTFFLHYVYCTVIGFFCIRHKFGSIIADSLRVIVKLGDIKFFSFLFKEEKLSKTYQYIIFFIFFFFLGSFWPNLLVFDQIEDNISWLPCFNDHFGISKHSLNPIWVTKALNRPKKRPTMVLNGKFSQPYSEYPVPAWAPGGAVHPLCFTM